MLTVKRFVFNPIQENTYVVYNGKDACALIDPGCYFPEEKQALSSWLKGAHLHPNILLNTHCHLDHVFGNKWAATQYDLELQMGEKEEWTFHFAPESGLHWSMPFENYSGNIIFLKDGDKIMMGDDQLDVLFTPGHSVGHVVFYNRPQGFVIGGDVLFRLGIGRTDLPGGDQELLLESIQAKILTLPDDVIVYPGHGEPTTIGYEKEFNPFLQSLQ
jgi:hydroxyacylglutathione hydrolase